MLRSLLSARRKKKLQIHPVRIPPSKKILLNTANSIKCFVRRHRSGYLQKRKSPLRRFTHDNMFDRRCVSALRQSTQGPNSRLVADMYEIHRADSCCAACSLHCAKKTFKFTCTDTSPPKKILLNTANSSKCFARRHRSGYLQKRKSPLRRVTHDKMFNRRCVSSCTG